jgi:two-component system, LuxR family, sensor kinase FixL
MPTSLRLPNNVSIDMLINIAQNIDDGIIITGAQLDEPGPRILYVNELICQITGYAEQELLGKTPRIFQGEGTSGAAMAHIRTQLSAGRSCQVELTNYRKNGEAFINELWIRPHHDSDGNISHFISIQRDVTKRNAVAEQLKGSLSLLQLFLKNVPIAVAILDRELRYVAVSPRWLLDYELEDRDIVGAHHYEVLPEIPERWREIHRRGLLGEKSRSNLDSFVRENGKVEWLRWELVPRHNGLDEIDGIIIFSELITERVVAENRSKISEERLKTVWDTVADAMIVIDNQGAILDVNKATTHMFGYEEAELLGQNAKILLPDPYCKEQDGYLHRYSQTGISQSIDQGSEMVAKRKNGQLFPVALNVNRIDHMNLFTAIVRDLSERVDLQRQVLEIAAEEDRRIGQELHDNLQQQLTGLGLLARSLAESLANDSSNHSARAVRLAEGLKDCINTVHHLAHGLIPVEVHASGLESALKQLASSVKQQSQIECNFCHDGNTDIKDNFLATHLYRIAQEAVTNALKHSQAKTITISLSKIDGFQELKISDDGVGIPIQSSAGGQGLKIMQYRASLFGGKLLIGPSASRGTEVKCRFQCS